MVMGQAFDFTDLFVLDLANNHQGKLDHGLRIIREVGQVVRENGVRAALKFQFRNLDTLIHPDYRHNSGNKNIQRFLSTRLSLDEFTRLLACVRENNLLGMCTPFDEESVQWILDMGIEVIKIASCSATDWPLLESVADCNKPVVFSTGGLSVKEIDDLVSFFDHRRVQCAILHCVSIYPTPSHLLELNQIGLLRQRYIDKTIGFSTHEHPEDLTPVTIAVAKGAQILERHVGIATDGNRLNAYSSTPAQIDQWFKAALKAKTMCGANHRQPSPPEELVSLDALKRGVYARRSLKEGTVLQPDDVYFAMPYSREQLSSGDWQEGIVIHTALKRNEPLLIPAIQVPSDPEKQVLFTAIHKAKGMLNEARIALPTEFETEFSHHYGIRNFPTVGAIMVTCVNRSYCKKLVIQLPGQRHPMHYHRRKEETFQVLHGVLEMNVENRHRTLYPGDIQLVQQGVWHEFWSENGVILEEVSTRHYPNDSYYEDKSINEKGESRKTIVNQWGRYQI